MTGMGPWAISNTERNSRVHLLEDRGRGFKIARPFSGRLFVRLRVLVSLLPRTEIIHRPKDNMVEKTPAHHQKKFDYLFFKIRTHKIQGE
jgi:hypothetical protein